MKRMLFLADTSSLHTFRWAESLVNHSEYEIHLVTLNAKNHHPKFKNFSPRVHLYRAGNIEVKETGNNWGYLFCLVEIKKFIRQIQPETICSIYLSSYGFLASLACPPQTTLCHIIIGTDIMVFPKKSFLHRALIKHSLKKGDLLVSASQAAAKEIKKIYDHPHVLTQQYGIKDEIKKYRSEEKKYFITSNRFWVKNSNIPLILDLLSTIKEAPLPFAIIGTPTEQIPSLQEKYGERFIFFPPLEQEENFRIVGQSVFYISLTSSDGAPLSVMEAMHLGAIPILSDIEPNREWVAQKENGLLLPLDQFHEATDLLSKITQMNGQHKETIIRKNMLIIEERGLVEKNICRFLAAVTNAQ